PPGTARIAHDPELTYHVRARPYGRLRERPVRLEQAGDPFAQRERVPRIGQRVAFREAAAEQTARFRIRELDDEVLVDGDDTLVQALEQQAQPVALAFDVAERSPQLPPHAL